MTSWGWHGFVDPVVGPDPQAPHPLGHAGLAGADDHAEARQRVADALEELPPLRAEHREVHDHGVQTHRQQVLRTRRGGEHPVLPAHLADTLREHPDEAGVGVDDRESYWARLDAHAGWARELGRRGHARDGQILVHLARVYWSSLRPSSPIHEFFTPIRRRPPRSTSRIWAQRWRFELVLDRQAVTGLGRMIEQSYGPAVVERAGIALGEQQQDIERGLVAGRERFRGRSHTRPFPKGNEPPDRDPKGWPGICKSGDSQVKLV